MPGRRFCRGVLWNAFWRAWSQAENAAETKHEHAIGGSRVVSRSQDGRASQNAHPSCCNVASWTPWRVPPRWCNEETQFAGQYENVSRGDNTRNIARILAATTSKNMMGPLGRSPAVAQQQHTVIFTSIKIAENLASPCNRGNYFALARKLAHQITRKIITLKRCSQRSKPCHCTTAICIITRHKLHRQDDMLPHISHQGSTYGIKW